MCDVESVCRMGMQSLIEVSDDENKNDEVMMKMRMR